MHRSVLHTELVVPLTIVPVWKIIREDNVKHPCVLELVPILHWFAVGTVHVLAPIRAHAVPITVAMPVLFRCVSLVWMRIHAHTVCLRPAQVKWWYKWFPTFHRLQVSSLQILQIAK